MANPYLETLDSLLRPQNDFSIQSPILDTHDLPTYSIRTSTKSRRASDEGDDDLDQRPSIPAEAVMGGEDDFGEHESEEVSITSPSWTSMVSRPTSAPVAETSSSLLSYFALPASSSRMQEQSIWSKPLRQSSSRSLPTAGHFASPPFPTASLSPPLQPALRPPSSYSEQSTEALDESIAAQIPYPAFASMTVDVQSSSSSLPSRNRPEIATHASFETPACDQCRRRKVKCDRKKPSCRNCDERGVECTANDPLKRRGPVTKMQRRELANAGYRYDRKYRQWRKIGGIEPN